MITNLSFRFIPWAVSLLVLVGFSACKKDDQPTKSTAFADLRVAQSFDWSSIRNIIVNVTVNEGNNGQVIDLLDANGARIDRTLIVANKARFNVRLSTVDQDMIIKSPVTGQQIVRPTVNTTEFLTLNSNAAALWSAASDSDGDSIPDAWDDFPNNPNLAFSTRMPHVGEHYLLFDDNWPTKGDHDFNDVAISAVYKFDRNADGRLIQGRVDISLLAFSSEKALGLGMELFTAVAGSTFAYPFGNAVAFNGVRADSMVQNTAIIYENIRQEQRIRYTNDGVGASAMPEIKSFSFNWMANIGGDYVWPNFFLFDASDRTSEVHLFGYPPTIVANFSKFATTDDASIRNWRWNGSFAMPNAFYRSFRNLPWGMEFFHQGFKTVLDGSDITEAYPLLVNWAESSGQNNLSWRFFPKNQFVFQNP
ncbi:MAG: LruC domain-containing protein [Sphingobacteriaceae bacterium]|nr:LruC domain-containing protein [Sphingobacteriaceae bacterium]